MEKLIHPNAIKASYLFRLSALLTLIYYFLFTGRNSSVFMIGTLITIILLIGAAHLIGKGNAWVRWVLLVLFLIVLPLYISAMLMLYKHNLPNRWFFVLQGVIQVIAIVLLFIPFKQVTELPNELIEPEFDSKPEVK